MDRLFDAFEAAGHQLFLVGGAVRDHLLGKPWESLIDLDFTTDATPDRTEAILTDAGLGRFDVGRRFGTLGAILRGPRAKGFPKEAQITTFRAARGSDAPWGEQLEGDLARRDFRMNAIAMARTGDIVDPLGGRADIEAGRICAVSDPRDVFGDDPLRMLRVARFVATLGFQADDALGAVSRELASTLLTVSRERWLHELERLLLGPHAIAGLEWLRGAHLLGVILPEVAELDGFADSCPIHHKDLWAHTKAVVARSQSHRIQRWAALLHDVGKVATRSVDPERGVTFDGHEAHSAELFVDVAQRFKLDKATARAVGAVISEHGYVASYRDDWSDAAVRRLARRAGPYLEAMLAFARADLTTTLAEREAAALARIDRLAARLDKLERQRSLRPRLPKGLGHAVIDAFGLSAGPAVGRHIARVTEACLDGVLSSEPTIEACLAFLRQGTTGPLSRE